MVSRGTGGSNPVPSSGESPANLRVFAGSGVLNRRPGAAETFSLALRLGRPSASARHGLRVRRHGGDVAAVWREKQTEVGSDDRIALERGLLFVHGAGSQTLQRYSSGARRPRSPTPAGYGMRAKPSI